MPAKSSVPPGKRTAFVSHYDCSRHDTGWGHPDHQGRLPAVMRAVHADMLALFDSLEEVEGRHADESELRLVHTPEYISRVRSWADSARSANGPIEIRPGLVASGATWDASLAAVGSVLQAVDIVLDGLTSNAFCAIRPAARDAGADGSGRFGYFNQVAIAARYLTLEDAAPLVLVLWGAPDAGSLRGIFPESRVRVVEVEHAPSTPPADGRDRHSARHGGDTLESATRAALESVSTESSPGLVLLSASFDAGAEGSRGRAEGAAGEYFGATRAVMDFAEAACGGRLVSILEGGYSSSLGSAIVGHLRALADLDPVQE